MPPYKLSKEQRDVNAYLLLFSGIDFVEIFDLKKQLISFSAPPASPHLGPENRLIFLPFSFGNIYSRLVAPVERVNGVI